MKLVRCPMRNRGVNIRTIAGKSGSNETTEERQGGRFRVISYYRSGPNHIAKRPRPDRLGCIEPQNYRIDAS